MKILILTLIILIPTLLQSCNVSDMTNSEKKVQAADSQFSKISSEAQNSENQNNTNDKITAAEEDDNNFLENNGGTNRSIEVLIKRKIANLKIEEDGVYSNITQESQNKLLKLLLPGAKKQFYSSYDAQVARLAKEISGLNIVKRVTVIKDNTKTITNFIDEKFGAELVNAVGKVRKEASSINNSIDFLYLESEVEGKKQTHRIKRSWEKEIQSILLLMHRWGVQTADNLFKEDESLQMIRKQNQESKLICVDGSTGI